MTVAAAPGAGPITVSTFVFGYQTFEASGVVDGEALSYNLTDFDGSGNLIAWELDNPGIWDATARTLTRAPIYSSNGNAAINAGPLAQVWLTPLAETLLSVNAASPVATKTTNYSILTTDNQTIFDNAGASGSVIYSLPAASPGLRYTFIVLTARILEVLAGGSDQIAIFAENSATGGNAQSNVPWSSITLIAPHGTPHLWVTQSMVGSWLLT